MQLDVVISISHNYTMTDFTNSTTGYRISFQTFNGFFGSWLKRNLFTRRRLMITIVLAIGLLGYAAITLLPQFGDTLFGQPSVPIGLNLLFIVLLVIVEFLIAFLMMAVPVYILSPVVSYLWLAANFMIGPVRKRVNKADLSEQGVTKSYEAYSHTTPWDAVHDLVETRKSLLIFTSPNGAMMIPKAAFATPEAAANFANAAQTFWHAAKLQKQDTPPPQA